MSTETKTDVIRTLGLYQPFATLMLHGKIETRWVKTGKKPPFPLGTYLIYACKKAYMFHQAEELMGDQAEDAHKAFRIELATPRGTLDPIKQEFLSGHAIAIGNLVRIIDPITPETNVKTFVRYMVPCTRRRVGLVFEDVKRIKPFPIKGKQGIGFLSVADHLKIEFV